MDGARKPAGYTCQKCDQDYPMGEETTVHLFIDQPWFNYLETTCPGCKTTYPVWDLQDATIQWLETHNMAEEDPVQWAFPLDVAPPEVVSRFLKRLGFRELNHAQEGECLFFRFLLERGETPDGNIPVQRDAGRVEARDEGAEGASSGAV